jgi:hypothetical protein
VGAGWLCEAADAPDQSWMSDAFWVRANDRLGHRTTVPHRTGVMQIYDAVRFVKAGDRVRQLFYGDQWCEPAEIAGFAARYGTLDPERAQTSVCVLDARGDGPSLTSAWLIAWGPRSIFMVTPDGEPSVGGGEMALVVRDWRFAIRIANIGHDVAEITLLELLDRALLMLPEGRPSSVRVGALDPAAYRPVFYMNARLRRLLGADDFRHVFIRAVDLRDDEQRVT